MEHQPGGPVANWDQEAAAPTSLALLSRQAVLLAVTLQLWVAGRQFDITVSKALDEAGPWAGQYWWEVDRLLVEGTGGLCREKRWALGLSPAATPEGAYEAAWQAVQQGIDAPTMPPAVGTSTGGAVLTRISTRT